MTNDILAAKLRSAFAEMVVYKDLKSTNFFRDLKLPSFLRDWLLRKFEDEEGEFDRDEMLDFVHEFLPGKAEWTAIKNRIVVEGERVKLLTRVGVDIDIQTGEVSFRLPDFGLGGKETMIEAPVWDRLGPELLKAQESWGVVELLYRKPNPAEHKKGRIKLVDFKNFCPYNVDLDDYKEARAEFTIEEWIDVVLGAIDLQADGYQADLQKRAMMKRLLPFVENRLNLIELAPKGTGKSYLYGAVSRFGYLSAGKLTRAKLFYDIARRRDGLIFANDFIAIDEVQKVEFDNPNEMTQTLQNYMEQGTVNIGDKRDSADCGFVLLGNIPAQHQNTQERMFDDLPPMFRISAFLERLHGFVEGWDIPRMNEGLKVCGWALNSEYFTSILHLLRDDTSYRSLVDRIVKYPANADTRHTEAVKRLCTAYLKLLFPNVRQTNDINEREFKVYCLNPAIHMRQIVYQQMCMLDGKEYSAHAMPEFRLDLE